MSKLPAEILKKFFSGDDTSIYEYIKAKTPELHFDYDEIMHYAHNRAFTVAKITKLDLLKDIQESLANAELEGIGFDEWKKNIKPTLAKKGWLGNVEVTNPKTGEIKNIYVGNRRLKNIYDTNMRMVNHKARYETQMQSDGEYFVYIAVMDSLTRPAHAKHHRLVLLKTDPFWDTHYGMNDHGCRCKVRVYTQGEIDKRGWKVADKAPPHFANKDFAFNPAKTDNINNIWDKKIDSIKDEKLKELAKQEKAKYGK